MDATSTYLADAGRYGKMRSGGPIPAASNSFRWGSGRTSAATAGWLLDGHR
jgi:hypothetical protein